MSPARRGVKHHKAKLNPDLVRQIRKWKASGITYVGIQERLGWSVSQGTISAVLRGQTWRHVE